MRTNKRKLKRLKNKLWRIVRRKLHIHRRIDTGGSPSVDHFVYRAFYRRWKGWKKENEAALPIILTNPDIKTIYRQVWL